jgi:hypothetical protein
LRDKIYELTAKEIGSHVHLTRITFDTATEADNWKLLVGENIRPTQATWSWREAYHHYKSFPKRFEISVYAGNALCGICYGKTSFGKSVVRLDLIGSTPVRPSPLGMAAFPVISVAATAYATAIGAEEICILDPINDDVVNYYMKYGYSAPTVYAKNRIALRKPV